MRYWITAALFLLGALIYAANHLGFFASSFANIRGTEIETIALKDLNGDSQAFSQLYGDETVVYFFASWCAPCYHSLSEIESVRNSHQLSVRFLAVALDDDFEAVKNMVHKVNYTGETWIASTQVLQQRKFGNERRAIPYTIKLNKHNEIIESKYRIKKTQWSEILVNGAAL